MRHSSSRIGADRHANGMSRSVVEKVDDTKLWQEGNHSLFADEGNQGVEHVHPYGFTAVPQKPSGQGKMRRAAEAIFSFLGGNRSHGIAMLVGDRRYRLYKLADGEVALHDDQGHQVHIKRDGVWVSAPNSKKVVAQIMDDDQMPQDPDASGGGAGQAQKMGQIKQAGRPAAVNMTLTKDKWTLNVPNVEINCQTMKCTVSDHFSTIGTTRLGQDDAAHPVYGENGTGKTSAKVFVNAVNPGAPTSLDMQP